MTMHVKISRRQTLQACKHILLFLMIAGACAAEDQQCQKLQGLATLPLMDNSKQLLKSGALRQGYSQG